MNLTRHILPGMVNAEGKVDPTPVIVTLDADGRITGWHPLDGHEPNSTTPLRALLSLPSLTLRPL